MKDNIIKNKVEFTKNNFIELFLYNLIIKGINKIDIHKLKYDLVEFYKNEYYKELFADFYLVEQDEKCFIELNDCIEYASLNIYLINPINDTHERLIFLEDLKGIYNIELQDKMSSLVDEYLLKLRKNLGLVKKLIN